MKKNMKNEQQIRNEIHRQARSVLVGDNKKVVDPHKVVNYIRALRWVIGELKEL